MTRQNELDLRRAEGFDKTKVLLAGNPEHPVHTFIFERGNEKFGALGNGFVPRGFNLCHVSARLGLRERHGVSHLCCVELPGGGGSG
jgi:hypothetical protein